MCIVQLFVRSFDLTSYSPYCSHFTAWTHHSTLQHLPSRCLSSPLFGSQVEEQQNLPQPNWTTWWNHSCCTGIPWLSALHCLYNLVRVPRRLRSPCHSHRSRTAQRHQVPCPARSRRSVRLSLIFRWASTHHATTAGASAQLSIPEFPLLCFTKHSFRRTVPLRIHEDLREAQTPSNTGNAIAAAFADAATQLSFAVFFERCILSRALPPRPQPSPTQLQDASTQATPHSAGSADATTQLPLTEFFLGCAHSNDAKADGMQTQRQSLASKTIWSCYLIRRLRGVCV